LAKYRAETRIAVVMCLENFTVSKKHFYIKPN